MDPISDALNRIKNAYAVNAETVVIPFSKMKLKILGILKDADFIQDVVRKTKKNKKAEIDYLEAVLKYNNETPAISGMKIISKPSRHMYLGTKEIRQVRSGFGLAIISTSKGIMTSKEARKEGVGGEILFEIW